MYLYMYTHVHIYICIYIHVHICVYKKMFMYIHIYAYIFIYIYICTRACVFYMHVCIQSLHPITKGYPHNKNLQPQIQNLLHAYLKGANTKIIKAPQPGWPILL